MNYYKHHLGDYSKDTRHLSMLEHGAYRLLLDHYYATEKPIPGHLADRIALARNGAEKKAVRSVLAQFFREVDGAWQHSKVVSVIEESKLQRDKKVLAAKARWEADQAMQVHELCNADAMLAISHKPLEDQEPSTSLRSVDVGFDESAPVKLNGNAKRQSVPIQKIVDLYHETLPMLPRCEKLTKTREGFIRARWVEDLPDLDHWRNYFAFVGQSRFLTGQADGKPGARPFRADLEWITRSGNYAKIAEEKYHGK